MRGDRLVSGEMSAPSSRALAAGCVGAVLGVLPYTLLAAPPLEQAPAAAAAPRQVLLLAASEAEERALDAVQLDLKELVEPTTLRAAASERHDKTSLLRLSEERHALAVIWLDQNSPRSLVVYVFEPESQRLGMRRLPRGSQADADESVGVVLRATVEALLEGRAAPLEAVALPAAPEAPPARHVVSEPEARERATLRTGYVGVGFAGDSLEHGAALGASIALGGRFHVGVDFAIVQPARLRQGQTSVTLTRRPLDAFAALGAKLGGYELFGEAGGSFDFRARRSETAGASLRASASTSYVVVSLLARIRLSRARWPRLRFDLAPALEVPLNEPTLTIDRAMADETVSHWRVRPRVEAGVSLVFR